MIQFLTAYYKSKKILEKSMYVAIKGNNLDGHNYIDQAILNGAKCIVCQILL